MLLQTEKLTKNFGGLTAISNLDFAVSEGEIRGLIGPNGSGKSTLFNLISGVYEPDRDGGRIEFDGKDITRKSPHYIAGLGVGRTFQLLRIFSEMTVLENLLVGHHPHVKYGSIAATLGLGGVWAEERRMKERMLEILDFVGLADFAGMPATELSFGQRRMVALARAVAMEPTLLMLDEPAAGLSPANVEELQEIIGLLRKRRGLTIIVVEHILKVVVETCDTVTVLDHGEKIGEGTPDEISNDHRVVEAYLGKEMEDEEVRKVFRS